MWGSVGELALRCEGDYSRDRLQRPAHQVRMAPHHHLPSPRMGSPLLPLPSSLCRVNGFLVSGEEKPREFDVVIGALDVPGIKKARDPPALSPHIDQHTHHAIPRESTRFSYTPHPGTQSPFHLIHPRYPGLTHTHTLTHSLSFQADTLTRSRRGTSHGRSKQGGKGPLKHAHTLTHIHTRKNCKRGAGVGKSTHTHSHPHIHTQGSVRRGSRCFSSGAA